MAYASREIDKVEFHVVEDDGREFITLRLEDGTRLEFWGAGEGPSAASLNYRGTWVTASHYGVNDIVDGPAGYAGGVYRSKTAHISGGVFSGPGVNWEVLRDPTGTYAALAGANVFSGELSIIKAGASSSDWPFKVGSGLPRGAPTNPLVVSLAATTVAPLPAGTYTWGYTETDRGQANGSGGGETTIGGTVTFVADGVHDVLVQIPQARAGAIARKVYRTAAGPGATFGLIWTFGGSMDSHQDQFIDSTLDGARGALVPTVDTTVSLSVLLSAGGLQLISGGPDTPTADNLTINVADNRDGASWCVDSYGPIATRTSLGSNYIGYHTGTTGAQLEFFYQPRLATVQGGQAPTLVWQVWPRGALTQSNLDSTAYTWLVAGGSGLLQYRANVGDVNFVFGIDNTGKLTWGAGGGTAPDQTLSRVSASSMNFSGQLMVGGAAGAPASNLQVKSLAGNATMRLTEGTGNAGITWTAVSGGPHTISTSNNLGLNMQQAGTTLIGFGVGATLGFFGANPIAKPTAAATVAGFVAGAGPAVDSAATFTGGVGATAYTIGDLVRSLKNLGLVTA